MSLIELVLGNQSLNVPSNLLCLSQHVKRSITGNILQLETILRPGIIRSWGSDNIMHGMQLTMDYLVQPFHLTQSQFPKVLLLSQCLRFDHLYDDLVSTHSSYICASNVCSIWSVVTESDSCRSFIVTHLHLIFDESPESFCLLSNIQLIQILQDDNLNLGQSGEDLLWELVTIWSKDKGYPRCDLAAVMSESGLLNYIKFPCLSPILKQAIFHSGLVPTQYFNEPIDKSQHTGAGTSHWRWVPRGQWLDQEASNISTPPKPQQHSSFVSPQIPDLIDPRSPTPAFPRTPIISRIVVPPKVVEPKPKQILKNTPTTSTTVCGRKRPISSHRPALTEVTNRVSVL